jgi:hypothetical protein
MNNILYQTGIERGPNGGSQAQIFEQVEVLVFQFLSNKERVLWLFNNGGMQTILVCNQLRLGNLSGGPESNDG